MISILLSPAAFAGDVGDLTIVSEPAGALVLVDGAEAGMTPLTVPGLAYGEHWIVVDGACGRVEQTAQVPGAVDVKLPGGSGTLAVTLEPSIATLEVDAAPVGTGSRDVLLGCGDHVVGASAAGYTPRTLTATVKAQDVTPLTLKLEPLTDVQAKRPLRWAAVGTTVAGAGALAIAGASYATGRPAYATYLSEPDDALAEEMYDQRVAPKRNAIYAGVALGVPLVIAGGVMWTVTPGGVAASGSF